MSKTLNQTQIRYFEKSLDNIKNLKLRDYDAKHPKGDLTLMEWVLLKKPMLRTRTDIFSLLDNDTNKKYDVSIALEKVFVIDMEAFKAEKYRRREVNLKGYNKLRDKLNKEIEQLLAKVYFDDADEALKLLKDFEQMKFEV
jgi:hypothetical protein